MFEQKRFRETPRIRRWVRVIYEQRLVITVVLFPLRVDLGTGAFAHCFAGNVVGIGHCKK